MSKVRKAIIPVAGLGTRFLPFSKSVPKEMLPIIDTPVIQLIVEEATQSGIKDIIFVSARGKDCIENHFDFRPDLEAKLHSQGKGNLARISSELAHAANIISVRQKEPLGLGHAVLMAEPVIGTDEPFAILLGDDLIRGKVPCTAQLIDQYERHEKSVIGVMEVPDDQVSKYGIIDGTIQSKNLYQVKSVVEKPSPNLAPSRLAIPGRYVLSSDVFKYLHQVQPGKSGEIQLTDGLEKLAQAAGLLAFLFEGERFDTGDRLGYIEATLSYALNRDDLRKETLKLLQKYLQE